VPNLPMVHETAKFSEFLKTFGTDGTSTPLSDQSALARFICYCGDDFEKQTLKNALIAGVSTSLNDRNTRSLSGVEALILIGPEGDFSAKEVALAVEHGFIPVTLGETRLRTETAAIVAVHTVSLTLQP